MAMCIDHDKQKTLGGTTFGVEMVISKIIGVAIEDTRNDESTPLKSTLYATILVQSLQIPNQKLKHRSNDRSVFEVCSEMAQSAKPITSPVPESSYPTLAFVLLAIGLVLTASFFIYEATSSRKGRSLTKELVTGGVASLFLGFGSLFLLLSCGVYV